MIDELSISQKDMIAILSGDKPQVEEIVEFLFSHSRGSAIPAIVLPSSPPWGKAH